LVSRHPARPVARLGACTPAHADLADELDAMFGSLVNVTNPTAHLGQRRGVLSGGSVFARNRILNTNLVNIVPPSFEAGCGGIDVFAGSFSFVSRGQLTQLIRAIASNAASYAFKLALDSMCQNCGQVMDSLQTKFQVRIPPSRCPRNRIRMKSAGFGAPIEPPRLSRRSIVFSVPKICRQGAAIPDPAPRRG
jgi:hypothetical protein